MGLDEDLKAAELRLKELEIEHKSRDLKAARRFDLARMAVWVTVIGGLAAVAVQVVGLLTSWNERERAQAAATSDFNFKGLELFVQQQEHLVTCDHEQSQRNVELFKAVFRDSSVTDAIDKVVGYRAPKCAAASQNAAAAEEMKVSTSPDQIQAAADKARYTTLAQQAPLLTTAAGSQQTKIRVFIQVNSDVDRTDAVALQATLIQKGYSAPGIEHVSTAPGSYQVRYYYADQKTDAETLAERAAGQLRIDQSRIQIPPPLETIYKSLPRQTLEFWFPRR